MKQEITFLFLVCFALLCASCYAGDDDVVYKFFNRKPTPQEGLIRIRFVMIKTVTSIFGGALMAIYVTEYILRGICSAALSKNQAVLLIVVCIGISHLLISVFQNGMRYLKERPQRPVIDFTIWRKNLRQWDGKEN